MGTDNENRDANPIVSMPQFEVLHGSAFFESITKGLFDGQTDGIMSRDGGSNLRGDSSG